MGICGTDAQIYAGEYEQLKDKGYSYNDVLGKSGIEAAALARQGALAPGFVPALYLYDPVMCVMAMQDVGDHRNLRYALLARETFSGFAHDIAAFMASTLMRTSDFVLSPREKRELAAQFVNPGMCDITERLVFAEPYKNKRGTNRPYPANRDFLEREIGGDILLHREAAQLKLQFQGKGQALLHGDLHSGSIFVKEGSTVVLDPEFACFGPAGYDVGNVMAHLMFAWANAVAAERDADVRGRFSDWVERAMCTVLDVFRERSLAILRDEGRDEMLATDGVPERYLDDILADAAGFAGCELIRRVIGSDKVREIEGIEDEGERVRCERICVLAAKRCIMDRNTGALRTGSGYVTALRDAAGS